MKFFEAIVTAIFTVVLFGVVAVILWNGVGGVVFGEAWAGYKDHVDSAFWVGTVASAVAISYSYLKRIAHYI